MVTAESIFNPKADNQKQSRAPEDPRKAECKAKGGRWNASTQLCEIPEDKTISTENLSEEEYEAAKVSQGFTPTDKKAFGPITDAETGRISGFTRGGKTYAGITPEQSKGFIEKEAAQQELQVGGQAQQVLTKRQQELQSQGLPLATQVGDQPSDDILTQLEEAITVGKVNYGRAFLQALPDVVPDVVGGGIAGFTAAKGTAVIATAASGGSAAGPSAAAVAGFTLLSAASAGVIGYYRDVVSDIRSQKREITEAPIRTLTETKSQLNDVISAQNSDPANAQDNLEAFNIQLATIDQAYDDLKELTDGGVDSFLGDSGINQLQEYDVYYLPGGERERQMFEMQVALANPDPTKINANTVTQAEIKEKIEKELKSLGITGVI